MHDPLLLEVACALGAGHVSVGPIHAEGELIHGYAVTTGKRKGRVFLNPSVALVDTAIHELIHRLRPKWSEATVRRRTAKIMRGLSNAEIDKFHELIDVTATVRKRALRVDVE